MTTSEQAHGTSEHLQNDLSVFFANSANFWRYPEITYSAANKFPTQILDLLSKKAGVAIPSAISALEFSEGADGTQLRDLFDQHGSDKGRHEYAAIYSRILMNLASRRSIDILEIGLGSTDPIKISTMGRNGRPGASLRAFRDYIPNAHLYGADIDAAALIVENRIKTTLVDQLRPDSFIKMIAEFNQCSFDLIIDDGLHSTEANINTLMFALDAQAAGR